MVSEAIMNELGSTGITLTLMLVGGLNSNFQLCSANGLLSPVCWVSAIFYVMPVAIYLRTGYALSK